MKTNIKTLTKEHTHKTQQLSFMNSFFQKHFSQITIHE